MTTIVDARGLPCPRPVINTKKALGEIEEGVITVIVDNPESKGNVTRFARSQGCQIEVEEREDASYLQITKGHPTEKEENPGKSIDATVVCITTNVFGTGSEELGAILMKAFLNTLWDYEPRPATLLFINSGVMLTTEGSEVLESLNLLGQEGVEIFSCGTCLEYYGIKDKLMVGKVTNMYETVVSLMNADKVVSV
ncbi:MAG: sulfurtransferase-like selenium metabolism protein YedF [Chloroflexota bacterium]|nr:sulfurtransferase-like selenium metabolism protein YedF [Chloroflexota bacterium]